MVTRHAIEQQLHKIGFNPFTWGRSEVTELCHVMMDDEVIVECVNGEYSNGFALLAATNHRVLLVDKKPFLYLTVEDLRFEQISDFNFRNRFLTATVTIASSSKTLYFMSYNKKRLRHLIGCVQRRVVDLRERREEQAVTPEAQQRVPEVTAQPAPSPLTAIAEQTAAAAEPAHPRLNSIATYTRSKLPLHLHHEPAADKPKYDQEYAPGSVPDYQAPA